MRTITILVALATLQTAVSADPLRERPEDYAWRLCPPERGIPLRPSYEDPLTPSDHTEIRADTSRILKEGISEFTGNVEVIRGPSAVSGEVVTYDPTTGFVNAEGRAHVWDQGFTWFGDSASYSLNSEVSRLHDGKYWVSQSRVRGYAGTVENDRVNQLTTLEDVDYTTCPESGQDWSMRADKITLNHGTDRGSARNAVLRVKNVPVFYLPYINFPISDKRKSGFLAPLFATTNESGFDFRLPYYWNIAPQHDATITPRVITDRGAMLGGQYRYLLERGRGEFEFEVLPDDDLSDGETRSAFSFKHDQRWQGGHRLNVDFANVSDDQYFEDFGRSIGVTSQRFVDRRAEYVYQVPGLYARTFVQSYQSVDDTIPGPAQPYKRIPSITVYAAKNIAGTRFTPAIESDLTYFSRPDSVTGGRFDIRPELKYDYRKTYLEITPRASVRQTQYFLDQPEGFDSSISRTVPSFDLNAKIFLERNFSMFGRTFFQTLEPQVYYLLIPKVGQDDIPIFDSGRFDINFLTLFQNNRFSGRDRIGDANQVTTALRSQILDQENGREVLRVSLGQIHYFRDLEITTVPTAAADDRSASELIGEVVSDLGAGWKVRGTLQWDPDTATTRKAAFNIRYNPDFRTTLNLGYRLRRSFDSIEQLEASVRWPIWENLGLVGRWNYSLVEEQTLEAVGGLEYESCCWGARLVSRRFLRNSAGEFDNGVFLEVAFRGLGGFGRKSSSLLRRGIPGYEDPFSR
ncbi:MAG: LPS-assembly protein LptD [Pseudomonadota bacterium]